MKILATFDSNDYEDTSSVLEKYTVRAIISQQGKLAMQCSARGEFKIPGGGLESGEDFFQALARETLEETGLTIQLDSIGELGEITEIRRDIFDKQQKFICHTKFYQCQTVGDRQEIHLTKSEIAKGYSFKWETPQKILEVNEAIATDPWILRDTAFIRMLVEGKVSLE